MRYFLPLFVVILLFPAIAAAQQNLQANCSNYSASLQPIVDDINRMDREIGTSSGNAKQRRELYKNYDSILSAYQKLENALLGHPNGSICTVNAGELRTSLNEMDHNLRIWNQSIGGKNGLSKKEYKSFIQRAESIQSNFEQLKMGFGPHIGGGPQMPPPPPNGHPGMQPTPPNGRPGMQPIPPNGRPGMQPTPPQQPIAMSQQTFETLKTSVRKEYSDDDKINVINAAIPYSNMTASQVDEILKLFTFDSPKLKALKLMHPKVIDPENAFLFYGHFSNDSISDVKQILDTNRPHHIYPLSKDTQTKVKKIIDKVTFESSQITVSQTIGATYQMTCEQLIDIMKVMSSDDAKVELAASVYPHLTDRENWFTVFNVLTFSSSKSKLEQRVK